MIEEQQNEASRPLEEEQVHGCMTARTNPNKTQVDLTRNKDHLIGQFPSGSAKETCKFKGKDSEEIRKLRRLEQVGIKVMSAAQRYGRLARQCGMLCTLHILCSLLVCGVFLILTLVHAI